MPVLAIVANGHRQRSAWPHLFAGLHAHRVIYEHVATVAQGHGIDAAVIVGQVGQLDLAPGLPTVTAGGCGVFWWQL